MESSNETNPGDNSKDPPVDVDDDIAPDSEVKVYTNEDEEEEGLPEMESALSRRDKYVEDVKSGLINESEQCKDARAGDHLAFARSFLHEEATLYQYLLNQQADPCALPGNVLNRGNSPASGSAATHPGLQPSLYHLPPPPPNYHYPMLGPAQLEAWHQYQSGTLHAGSPYSLPINTSGSMSRFSPGGLHGHHPGLTPAGSGHPRTLLHIKPENLDAVSDVNHQRNYHGSIHSGEKECLVKKKDVNHIPKPLNAFMHYPGLSPGAGLGPHGGHPHTLPDIKPADLDAVSNVNHQLNHHGSIHRGEKEAEKEGLVKKEDVNRIPNHAGSPYSLPINTSGSMSRFSPGELHGHHHPGISPGAGLGPQGGHPYTLPHLKPAVLDAVSNINHQLNHHGSIHRGEKEREAEKECLVKKKDVNHIPKPLNAFMLYMKEMRPVVKAECTLKESAAINKILGKEILESFLFCMYLGSFTLLLSLHKAK